MVCATHHSSIWWVYTQVVLSLTCVPPPVPGTLRWRLPEGSILAAGDLIASLDLADPAAVTTAEPFTGSPSSPPHPNPRPLIWMLPDSTDRCKVHFNLEAERASLMLYRTLLCPCVPFDLPPLAQLRFFGTCKLIISRLRQLNIHD